MAPACTQTRGGCVARPIAAAMARTESTRDADQFTEIFRRVTALDVAPGEIDHGFRAIEELNPFAGIFPVPQNFLDAVVAGARRAREHDHFVIPREQFRLRAPGPESRCRPPIQSFLLFLSIHVPLRFRFPTLARLLPSADSL